MPTQPEEMLEPFKDPAVPDGAGSMAYGALGAGFGAEEHHSGGGSDAGADAGPRGAYAFCDECQFKGNEYTGKDAVRKAGIEAHDHNNKYGDGHAAYVK